MSSYGEGCGCSPSASAPVKKPSLGALMTSPLSASSAWASLSIKTAFFPLASRPRAFNSLRSCGAFMVANSAFAAFRCSSAASLASFSASISACSSSLITTTSSSAPALASAWTRRFTSSSLVPLMLRPLAFRAFFRCFLLMSSYGEGCDSCSSDTGSSPSSSLNALSSDPISNGFDKTVSRS